MAPLFFGSLYAWFFAGDNPLLTQTQLSNLFMPYMLLAAVPAMVGIILVHSGMEDYDDLP